MLLVSKVSSAVLLVQSSLVVLAQTGSIVLCCSGGYRGGSPTAVRPSDPALCGSCPL